MLTKAHRAAVSMMAKGSIVARVLPSEVFLIFTTELWQYFSLFFLFALFSDAPEIFLPKFSQTANTSCCSLPEGSKGGWDSVSYISYMDC